MAVLASIAAGIIMASHRPSAVIGRAPLYLPFRVDNCTAPDFEKSTTH
jgi:hypothetical protein